MTSRLAMVKTWLDRIRDELEMTEADFERHETERDAEIKKALQFIVKLNKKEDPDKAIWKAQLKAKETLERWFPETTEDR